MRRLLFTALACSTLANLPDAARAQGTPPSLTGSAYRPGVNVLDYDVHLELPDSGLFLRGDVTVTARRAPSLATLRLDLIDSLTVRSVEVDGRRVTATHSANALDVPLSGAKDDTVRIRVVYDGPVHDGLVVRKDAKGRWTWFGDNWPDRTRQWLPTVDHPSDKATVSWTVRAPTGRTVVGNGVPLGAKPLGGGRTETRWRESRPIPPSLMVIAAGPLERVDLHYPACHKGDRGQCVPQMVYVLPENVSFMPGAFRSAGPIVNLFEDLIGPFPYEKLAHLQSNTRFGGMENASAIFYDGRRFPSKITDDLIAHETAHQWFGDAVTEREWAHLWLSEGFADYFAALWMRHAHGDTAFRRVMAASRAKILADPAVASRPVIDTAQTNYLELLNANSYDKGAWVLFMLHQQLGDSAFFHGLRSYYAKYRDSTALSDDLRRELEQTSGGRSLQPFFDQWLRRPGFAEPAIGWAFDAATGRVSLFVQQESARGPYAFPLTVVVTDAENVTHRLTVTVPADARATLPLTGRFDRKPKSLSFDPDGLLLARITRL